MEDRAMGPTPQSSRHKSKEVARMRRRRKPSRQFDPLQVDDDDEEIVEIGGEPPEEKGLGQAR
jgi:hypothetical protein